MKLYLASHGLNQTHLERLHDMVGSDKRLLFVDNAKDELPPEERAAHVEEKRKEFTDAGFEFFELDLRDYFRSPDRLKRIFRSG